jgi:surface antigen/uncharacterized protein (DUF427 family)
MDVEQRKALKNSLKVNPRAAELLREIVKAKPRTMRLEETKRVKLSRKQYRLSKTNYQKISTSGEKVNFRSPLRLNEVAAQKKVVEARRDLSAHKKLLKQMKKKDSTYLPTQLKNSVKISVQENLKSAPLSVLKGDDTLEDGVEKARKSIYQVKSAKNNLRMAQTGGRIALNTGKRTYGLSNRTLNLMQGKGFTRTPEELKIRKIAQKRFRSYLQRFKIQKEAKKAQQITTILKNMIQGQISPKLAASALAKNPVTWIVGGIIFLLLVIVAGAVDVPNPSIKQSDFELTESWSYMTKLDVDHSTDGNSFFTDFDPVMFYMNQRYDDYNPSGSNDSVKTVGNADVTQFQTYHDIMSDLWTALNGTSPNYSITTMDKLETETGGKYTLSTTDYSEMNQMITDMGYAALDGQLSFPIKTDNLVIDRRFGYEGSGSNETLHHSIDVTTTATQQIVAPLEGKVTVDSNSQLMIENTNTEERVILKEVDTSRFNGGETIQSGALVGSALGNYLDITVQKYDDSDKTWKYVNPAFYFPKVTYTQMTSLASNSYNPNADQLASAQAIYNYAMAHGGNLNGICAVLGNFQVEGNIDPTSVETIFSEPFEMGPLKQQAQSEGFMISAMDPAYSAQYPAIVQAGIGWGQWTNERDVALLAFAKAQNKNWYDPALQIQFATTGDSPGAITALNNTLDAKVAQDIPTLTNYFLNNWEGNPGNKIADRVQAAQDWYAYFIKAASGGSSSANVAVPAEYVGKLTMPAPNQQDITGYPGNNYALNNCTWYVYNREYQLGKIIPANLGNGGQWGQTAQAAGYHADSTPQVGDMASFSPGTAGSSTIYGHVAFVEYVNPDGSFLVSEMNVVNPGSGQIDYRTIQSAAGVTFINPNK